MRTAWEQIGVVCIAWTLLTASVAHAGPYSLSYAGRLTSSSGTPLSGQVTLKVEFFRDQEGGAPIPVTLPDYTVALRDGVFQISIELSPSDFNTVFNGTDEAWIQITDVSSGKVYPRQTFTVIPYALKVPIDDKTLTYDANGNLTLSSPRKTASSSPHQAVS